MTHHTTPRAELGREWLAEVAQMWQGLAGGGKTASGGELAEAVCQAVADDEGDS